MKVVLILILLMPFVFAACEDGQIDINSASEEELTEINYVGEVRAAEIVSMRPFDSVDDLVRVYGIGEKTMERIKSQGLACVEDDNVAEAQNSDETLANSTKPKIIVLTGKSIKSENDIENSGENNLAIYGFIGFCILLCLLFAIKFWKNDKNEFG